MEIGMRCTVHKTRYITNRAGRAGNIYIYSSVFISSVFTEQVKDRPLATELKVLVLDVLC
jgi:hypothetical protein